jgi:hypothetical protein
VVILLADQKVRSDNLVELALIYCKKASEKALEETASQAAGFNLAKDCLHDHQKPKYRALATLCLGVLNIASQMLDNTDTIYHQACKLAELVGQMQDRWHTLFFTEIHSLRSLEVWPAGVCFA